MRLDLTKKITPKDLSISVQEFISPFDFIFFCHQTVEDVLKILQSPSFLKQSDFLFVIDHENNLLGLVDTKELVFQSPETRLDGIVDTELVKLQENETLEDALKMIAHHQILVVPIVDADNHLLGVFEVLPDKDVPFTSKRLVEKNLKEDIFQFIGFTIEQGKYTSSWRAFRYRMPWLGCNLIGGLICALIGEVFQYTLVEFVVLALFIPLVLTLSESVSIQSMTLSLRFIHLKKIYWSQIVRRLVSEWKTSLLLALASGLVIGCFYFIWSSDIKPVIAITGSLLISMVASATFGALFPILLHLLRLDPKVAAGPVVLMLADIVTITIYLSFSTLFLL